MKRRLALLGAGLLALPAAKAGDPLAGRTAGKPVDCISGRAADDLHVLDRNTLVASFTNRRLWVTHPVGGCPALDTFTTIIVERYGNQLCRNDRFRVREPNSVIPSAYCRLGAFVPYDKAAPAQ